MRKLIIVGLVLMALLYACKEDGEVTPSIIGNWRLTHMSDTAGVLRPTNDSMYFLFVTNDSISYTATLGTPPVTFNTWYKLSDNVFTVDSSSIFSAAFCGPLYNVVELNIHKFHIKGQCKASEMVFEK